MFMHICCRICACVCVTPDMGERLGRLKVKDEREELATSCYATFNCVPFTSACLMCLFRLVSSSLFFCEAQCDVREISCIRILVLYLLVCWFLISFTEL